jgi:hypothetical protein
VSKEWEEKRAALRRWEEAMAGCTTCGGKGQVYTPTGGEEHCGDCLARYNCTSSAPCRLDGHLCDTGEGEEDQPLYVDVAALLAGGLPEPVPPVVLRPAQHGDSPVNRRAVVAVVDLGEVARQLRAVVAAVPPAGPTEVRLARRIEGAAIALDVLLGSHRAHPVAIQTGPGDTD